MATKPKEQERVNLTIRTLAHRKAELVTAFNGETLIDFVGNAIDRVADPILVKHGFDPKNLPAKK